jgi:hypothetical protein
LAGDFHHGRGSGGMRDVDRQCARIRWNPNPPVEPGRSRRRNAVVTKFYQDATHQLDDAELDIVTGAQSIWKGPGGPRTPQKHIGGPGEGDTIDVAPVGGTYDDTNNYPGGIGPWGN